MSDTAVYTVFSSGKLVDGFERENVVEAFSELFAVTPDNAQAYVDTRKVVKRKLSLEQAEQYQQRLGKIGIETILEEQGAANESKVSIKPDAEKDVAPALALVPEGIRSDCDDKSSDPNAFICPKCNLCQEKSEQCTGCGVFFNKVTPAPDVREENVKDSSAKALDKAKERKAPVIDESSEYSATVLLFPIAAAILGAILWKLIAVSMGYELGLVALAIGGAIGFAAAIAGGRGDTVGILCAVLVLLSIFGGKYLTYSSYQSQLTESLSSEVPDDDLLAIYNEEMLDATDYSMINKNDDSDVKAFMVDHAYTEAGNASSVSDTELQEFREFNQEWLEEFGRAQPSYDEWMGTRLADLGEIFENVSTTRMVFGSLGLLDLLFLFIGVSTAWKIGRAGQS